MNYALWEVTTDDGVLHVATSSKNLDPPTFKKIHERVKEELLPQQEDKEWWLKYRAENCVRSVKRAQIYQVLL